MGMALSDSPDHGHSHVFGGNMGISSDSGFSRITDPDIDLGGSLGNVHQQDPGQQ